MSDQNKINVTSHNQMGGITAHTVNVGPPARQMNDQIGEQLKQQISVDSKVTVVAVVNDSEAFAFAKQILEWLKGNGYPNANGIISAQYFQPVTGLNINKTSNGFQVTIGTRE